MKVTLQVNGQEMTFSEVESITINEEVHSSATIERGEDKNNQVAKKHGIVERPTEEKWFEVKPQSIDQGLFIKKRADGRQEETRQLILEAFAEVKANPEKYSGNFKTMMPKKDWDREIVAELEKKASQLGDHIADWVEQALEWAQRIANGETWKDICNDPDTANWYRLVKWKDGYFRLVGGSRDYVPVSDVSNSECVSNCGLNDTVPLVVLYEK